MKWLKKWAIATALSTLSFASIAQTNAAQTIDATKPYDMMRQVAEKTFSRLKNEQSLIKSNPDTLKVVVEEELMPFVNSRYAALKLLGPHLKTSKKEEVKVFVDAFRAYLVTSYAQVLTQYTDQSIEFAPERPLDPQSRILSIRVEIIDNPNPNIKLDFKLRKDKNSGEWAAFDMVAEGISLLSSKQSEWTSKIRKDGLLAVSKDLQELAAQPIQFKDPK
ncbi:phospholipid-binding protein MlaC [Vibrio sp. S9_S30]|uniref:phospholipid-binding protein MlaC n=1 Tax=Vibrio sp. S9_S30 TaxID=2720226 RepID=UPI0016815AF2|nr:phospholipid-binding protein MlaC [Vibrio sp. S9_S30]MBD1555466.1 phospholipid-binding protein MlaC [Vibrio sp. S9_S30]